MSAKYGDKLYPDQLEPPVKVYEPRHGDLVFVSYTDFYDPSLHNILDTYQRLGYTVVVTPRVGA